MLTRDAPLPGVQADPTEGNWIAADDYYRNVKELDEALNGPGGATRPLLIDVLSQVQAIVRKTGKPLLAHTAEPPINAAAQEGDESPERCFRSPASLPAAAAPNELVAPLPSADIAMLRSMFPVTAAGKLKLHLDREAIDNMHALIDRLELAVRASPVPKLDVQPCALCHTNETGYVCTGACNEWSEPSPQKAGGTVHCPICGKVWK
jgi:hypothetical protein